jgi:hypothetical protein
MNVSEALAQPFMLILVLTMGFPAGSVNSRVSGSTGRRSQLWTALQTKLRLQKNIETPGSQFIETRRFTGSLVSTK